ncbi:MAG TPA: uracil-DNA glycosylase [Xanthobacteraceae bacterium]|nr:uracil-DNA glycosylase [Xanthobacteraceae bacterium]
MNVNRRQAAIDALAFQFEAGVDVALDETAPDRFAEQPKAPVAATSPARGFDEASRAAPPVFTPAPIAPPASPPVLPGAEAAVTSAREAAKSAATLDALRAELARFDGCALKTTAMNLVFADGNPEARVMLVGEAPGAEEDREGLPFVGRSGKLLDRMLAAVGLDRTQVYIANIVPWRPPGNRTPTPQESAICLPFIRRQIELVNPDILVCLGKPSMQTLLGIKDGIRSVRGRWYDFDTGTRTIKALVTFHPAYLLRSPLEKRHSWRDFLALKKALARPL